MIISHFAGKHSLFGVLTEKREIFLGVKVINLTSNFIYVKAVGVRAFFYHINASEHLTYSDVTETLRIEFL